MTSGRITLIGTIHRDPRGAERLATLLAELGPDCLTLEMSPASLRYRQQHGRLLLQRLERIVGRLDAARAADAPPIDSHPAVADIRELLDLPFEYRAAADYAAAHGRSLVLVDDSAISEHKLRLVETELINLRNLRTLTSLTPLSAHNGEESYASARALLAADAPATLCRSYLDRRRGAEGIGERDRLMAAALTEQLRRFTPRHLVHIGGWVHLIADPAGETLFSRLSAFAPDRRLLA